MLSREPQNIPVEPPTWLALPRAYFSDVVFTQRHKNLIHNRNLTMLNPESQRSMRKPDYIKLVWIGLFIAAAIGAAVVTYAVRHGPLPN